MPIVSKLDLRSLLRLIELTIELRGDRIFHHLRKMKKESDQTVLSQQHPSFLLLLAILQSMVVDLKTKLQIAYKQLACSLEHKGEIIYLLSLKRVLLQQKIFMLTIQQGSLHQTLEACHSQQLRERKKSSSRMNFQLR